MKDALSSRSRSGHTRGAHRRKVLRAGVSVRGRAGGEMRTSWCMITLFGMMRFRCLASVVLPEHVAPLRCA